MEHIAGKLQTIIDQVYGQLVTLSPEAAATRPAAGQWSPKEIVGHLVDSAANNHQRFVRLLENGELTFPPYKQENWVRLQSYRTAQWEVLLALWRAYNLHLTHVIRQIPEERRSSPCTIGSNPPVTLEFLVEDYLAHLNLHVTQLGL